ncbi:MAG: hypothetical protein JXP73_02925 [Deltaproteobacteria bacterium]|nr:hypothetical protein [Deltaproteobacteria bacterium]
MRALGATLLLLSFLPATARAEGYEELGTLERSALDAALAARGLVIDTAPEGKRVGIIHVVNLDVFQPSDGRFLQWFNHFHWTTREHHIWRDSLLRPGMAYDPALVNETMRNLRNRTAYSSTDPANSGIVAIAPVESSLLGVVDLLIVTRDVWSLRFNSDPSFQYTYLVNLTASLSENNLFGRRKQVALGLVMSQGDVWLGPTYLDPNVLGSRLRLTAAFYAIWSRHIGELGAGSREGMSSLLRLEYPLFSLASRWGAFASGGYTTRVLRYITSSDATGYRPTLARFLPAADGSAAGDCVIPTGAPGDPYAALPADCAYRRRTASITSGITRSFPRSRLVHRVTMGSEFGQTRLSFLPTFPADPDIRRAFQARYFGPSERTSALYMQYVVFTPRYFTFRNLDTFDLGEDMRLGPWFSLKLGRAGTWLGSDTDFSLVLTEAHLNLGLFGGFQTVGASWESRVDGAGFFDQLVKGELWAASPILARSLRIVASGRVGFMLDNRHRAQHYVGGLHGLRGYPVDYFAGYDYYLAHLEVRSMAFSLASLRIGGLVFADAGHAADRVLGDAERNLPGLELYGDVGLGLRVLIPQLNAEVARCDWAFPLRGTGAVKAGWPGVPYCGFRQAF